jgi:hypothetical protein
MSNQTASTGTTTDAITPTDATGAAGQEPVKPFMRTIKSFVKACRAHHHRAGQGV